MISQKIDAYVQNWLKDRKIAGLVLGVFDAGEPLFNQGYGFANLEHQVPVTPDTVFSIASITKLFTGTAVFQLIDQGKLNLSDPIGIYLPDLPPAWQPIQIHHILAHQSGIKSYTEVPAYWEMTRQDKSYAEVLALMADLPLQFAPGERYTYDNTGYYLLGLLIEAVSSQTYGDFLQQHIFAPLGMRHTRVNDPSAVVPGRASGYTVQDGDLHNAEFYSASNTFSAGVLLSTVNDLGRFGAALHTDQLLSAASRQQMWTPHLSQAQNELKMHFSVGFSWFFVSPPGKRPFIGHNGGMVGFASAFIHFADEQVTAVALYNTDNIAEPHMLAHEAVELYLTEK
ncbi:MAG: beta-lactamase family protein [Ardenticatenaceae bacterium]|nr:beta-lactamase family protein [Anaerolineales bacterium]MCB8979945.1 beta-lactamase family protein [Ardenticatenaceae bacterium]